MFDVTANLIVAITSFFINIPLGYKRESVPKFSPAWFIWIHASIPLIIFMRIELGSSKWLIPVNIALAVIGQIVGSRYRRSKFTEEDKEKMSQVYDFHLPVIEKPQVKDEQVLVALMNMGGPKNLDEVEPFLWRLFNDHRIIRFPGSPWIQRFYAWLIIRIRLKAVIENYRTIGGGSPILPGSMKQCVALQKELQRRGRDLKVALNFNYSSPFPADTIRKAKNANRNCVLPVSLYPHYSNSTTDSNLHYLKEAAKTDYPEATFLQSYQYHLSDDYIDAFVERIHAQVGEGEHLDDFFLMFSAHGTPLYFLKEGDIYAFQIAQSIAKILDRLKRKYDWVTCYQSSVGPLQWLKPSTDDMIKALGRRNVKKVIVTPISFVTDHIETLEEIQGEYKELAEEHGIHEFRCIKALEDHPKFIKALADCVEDSLTQYQESKKEEVTHG